MNETQKAVVTVIGKDMVGILSSVSAAVADAGANVLEMTQSILDGYFCLIMILEITEADKTIEELREIIGGRVPDMVVHVMHENIFDAMHRI